MGAAHQCAKAKGQQPSAHSSHSFVFGDANTKQTLGADGWDPAACARWWASHFDVEEYSRAEHRVVFRVSDLASLRSARDTLRDAGVELEAYVQVKDEE